MTNSQIAITVIHALVGWALCGATMGIALATTTLKRALIVHAAAAPIIFGVISYIYFTHFAYTTPVGAALIFVGVVIVMDFFVVALLIQRKLEMFKSVAGTWLPFGLIFAATYAVGYVVSNWISIPFPRHPRPDQTLPTSLPHATMPIPPGRVH
jgi:NADH:ubiquinone oxidoreductase subunit 6 (subunit J)